MRQVKQIQQFILLLLAILLLVLPSCEIINPEEEIPAYIHISSFDLKTAFDEGTDSHNITDVWVYVDQDIQGIYELPVSFPLLASGEHTITVRPGIKINGIASTRIYYPFYNSLDYTVELVPGETDTISPKTSYQDEVIFEWLEGFENPGISMELLSSSDTNIDKTSDPALVFEGDFSGVIRLNEDNKLFEAMSIGAYELPGGLTPSYLEMNFRTNNRVVVGLVANGVGETKILDILVLNPTDDWKKIYVNLGATVSRQSGIVDYSIYLRAYLDDGVEEAEILIDNLKLIHY